MSNCYTVNTLAEHWSCSPDFVYAGLQSGRIRGFKLGRSWRISEDAVREYEQANTKSTFVTLLEAEIKSKPRRRSAAIMKV